MNQHPESDPSEAEKSPATSRGEGVGRLLLLIAGGILMSVLVSCACGPVR